MQNPTRAAQNGAFHSDMIDDRNNGGKVLFSQTSLKWTYGETGVVVKAHNDSAYQITVFKGVIQANPADKIWQSSIGMRADGQGTLFCVITEV